MKAIRCLIIDDERLARSATRHLLEKMPDVEIAGEAGSLTKAKDMIEALKPDLILLDIELPGGKGFDLLNSLSHRPWVILITAYENYALHAFDFDVVDYLLKPVRPEKLARALERLRRRMEAESLKISSPDRGGDATMSKLIAAGQGKVLFDPQKILAILADGNYTRVILTGGKEEFLRRSMREWEETLPEAHFRRIDRKMIVQLDQIGQLTFQTHQACFHLGDFPEPFVVGRSAAASLKSCFQDI